MKIIFNIFRYVNPYAYTCGVESNGALDIKSTTMEILKKYLDREFENLDRGIVATPKQYDYLESFAKANHGSSDILLMQMAIQYGYNLALEGVFNEIGRIENLENK